uniref:Uncharacterized protein n=1 Tax=Strombidium rassoulzadegani TaxID=1082188 RepID=A0A7S3CNA0_9SPIT|mmetsp:Transcript_18142/g.30998  ORF Transcript_18142/g.30998 Transcript_18142/m.30998 type:complete len:117 (+) Transcript_18142:271-621(+)
MNNVSIQHLKKAQRAKDDKFQKLMSNFENSLNKELEKMNKNLDLVNKKTVIRRIENKNGGILEQNDRRVRRIFHKDSNKHVKFQIDEDSQPFSQLQEPLSPTGSMRAAGHLMEVVE